jgi:hypothetical protein
MKKLVDTKDLRNLMTLAADLNYTFFPDTIIYMGYYCLFSVAMVKKENPSFNLNKEQIVITSPMIDNNTINNSCTIYKTIDIDAESGLLIPIISWALEFTKSIMSSETPVYLEKCDGLIETLLMQIWEYENVKLSVKGTNIDLLNPVSWEAIVEKKIRWDDHDSLAHAENLLRNGLIGFKENLLPHAHTENINCFHKADVSKGVIFDW